MAAICAGMATAIKVGVKAPSKRSAVRMMAASGRRTAADLGRPEGLWVPAEWIGETPAWLNGSLPGDRGFDPLGLGKPAEYLQFDLDGNDINGAKQSAGEVIGKFVVSDDSPSADALQPFQDAFGLQRFRENEIQHGRWAMLGALGVLAVELSTGTDWFKAISSEWAAPSFAGLDLPWTQRIIVLVNTILVGGAEILRNTELDPERRIYPGGPFDPLGLASGDDEKTFRLKTAEVKHGRLAMVACAGFAHQAFTTASSSPFANLSSIGQ